MFWAVSAKEIPKSPTNLCINNQCSAAPELGVTAKSAAAFVESVGIVTHFADTKTPYVSAFASAKQKLLALGIRHIRDGAIDRQGGFSEKDQAALFRDLGNAGIRVDFVFRPDVSKDFVQGFPARVAPAFESYEQPNEYNAVTASWVDVLRAWAPTFQSYIRSNNATANYPIVGASLIDKGNNPYAALGDLSAYMDFGNTHAYYGGRDPATMGWGGRSVPPCDAYRYGSLAYNACNAHRVCGTKPVMATETGWGTNTAVVGNVPPVLQAKYLARMLLLHFDAGITRSYIYQLLDSGSDGYKGWGLLTSALEERPSYREIKALMEMMRDGAPVDHLGSLSFSIVGDTTDVRAMLLQKSDGSFRLVLWIEQPGNDPFANNALGAPIAVPPRNVTLHLQSSVTAKTIATFQDGGDANSVVPRATTTGDYAMTLTDNLTVVEIAAR